MLARGALIGAAALLGSCTSVNTDAPPSRTIRIATGNPLGVYHALGTALSGVYTETVAGVQVSAESSEGLTSNLHAVETGSADLAFATADAVYGAYVQGTRLRAEPHTRLRGIAVLHTNALQIVVRRDSPAQTVRDLNGARIAFAVAATDLSRGSLRNRPRRTANLMAAAYGLAPEDFQMVRVSADDIPEALASRRFDSAIAEAGFPTTSVTELASRVGVRLLEIDGEAAARIRAQYPFYKPVVIPADTYPGQPDTVRTIGIESLLFCHQELDEDLVYRLTKLFFETLPRLEERHGAARHIDPDLAPATPIPLHAGAARYYRERELVK